MSLIKGNEEDKHSSDQKHQKSDGIIKSDQSDGYNKPRKSKLKKRVKSASSSSNDDGEDDRPKKT
jgi:hypothetical protein